MKDPEHRKGREHTLEMFTFVPYEPFARWKAASPDGERDLAYQQLKADLGRKYGISRATVYRLLEELQDTPPA